MGLGRNGMRERTDVEIEGESKDKKTEREGAREG